MSPGVHMLPLHSPGLLLAGGCPFLLSDRVLRLASQWTLAGSLSAVDQTRGLPPGCCFLMPGPGTYRFRPLRRLFIPGLSPFANVCLFACFPHTPHARQRDGPPGRRTLCGPPRGCASSPRLVGIRWPPPGLRCSHSRPPAQVPGVRFVACRGPRLANPRAHAPRIGTTHTYPLVGRELLWPVLRPPRHPPSPSYWGLLIDRLVFLPHPSLPDLLVSWPCCISRPPWAWAPHTLVLPH